MTGVYAGVFDDPGPIKPPAQIASKPAYAGVFDDAPAPQVNQATTENGFWNYTKNLVTRGYKLYSMTQGAINANDPDELAILKSMADPIQGQKMKDFGSLFGEMTKDVGAQIGQAASKIAEQGLSLKDLPTFAGQFAKGMEKPIGDLLELSSGVQLTQDDIRALTPEEKRARLKNAAATAVMLGVGKAAHSGMEAVLGMEGAAAGAGGAAAGGEWVSPSSVSGGRGLLAKKLLTNAVVGATAGASYGVVEGAGEDDQLSRIISNGIFGGTLGTGFDLLFGGTGKSAVKSMKGGYGEVADKMNLVRQLQSDGNSIADNIRTASAMQVASDTPEAIMLGKIKPGGINHITGLTGMEVSELATSVPEGYAAAHHFEADGKSGSVLVYDKALNEPSPLTATPGETITGAALRVGDRYFSGATHSQAGDAARKAGIAHGGADVEPGFISSAGRFVSDAEAHQIGIANGQIPADWAPENISSESFRAGDKNFGTIQDARTGLRSIDKGSEFSNTKPPIAPIDTKFFSENGYMKGQVVSHNGVEHTVLDGDGKNLTLEPLNKTKYEPPALAEPDRTRFQKIENWLGFSQDFGKGAPGITREVIPNQDPAFLAHHDAQAASRFVYRDERGIPRGAVEVHPGIGDLVEPTLNTSVHPDFQRQGIATKLYEAAKAAGIDIEAISKRNFKTMQGRAFAEGRATKAAIEAENLVVPRETVRATTSTEMGKLESVPQRTASSDTPEDAAQSWKAESDRLGTGTPGITHEQKTSPTGMKIDEFVYRDKDGIPRGTVAVSKGSYGDYGINSHVDPTHVRQGIATKLYAAGKAAGFDMEEISSYGPKTTQGEAFAAGRARKAAFENALRIGDATQRINGLYSEWRSSLEKPEPVPVAGEKAPEPLPDLLDDPNAPDLISHIDEFIASKKMSPAEGNIVKREFQQRLTKESIDRLEPEEQAIIAEADKERVVDTRNAAQRVKDARDLQRIAKTNGMITTDGGSGRVIVRDLQTKRILGGFDTNEEAARFMNKTGQAEGADLDANGSVDTGVAGGGRGIPPDEPQAMYPQDQPYNFFSKMKNWGKAAFSEDFMRGFDNFPHITRYRDYMLSLDRKYGTKLHEKIVEPINKARNIRNALIKPHAEELAQILQESKLNPGDGKEIGDYMQTMSPEDVAARGMARPMNATERAFSHKIVDSKVDVERIFTYRRELDNLNREFPQAQRDNDPTVEMKYQQEIDNARDAFGMDDKHLNINEMFDAIEKLDMNRASLGAVVRYARALDNGAGQSEMSQADFIKNKNLTMNKVAAASRLSSLYGKLADVFGIDKKQMLGGFMTHAKLYMDGDVSKAMRSFSGDLKAKEFYAKMTRTGEISAYEDNAFKAMMRYMKAGFDVHSGFSDSIARGSASLEQELLKLPGNAQGEARNVAQRYMNDVQGFPEAGDRATQEAVDYMMNKYKLGEDVNVKRGLTALVSSTVNSAALGFRPMLGIGHFGISTIMSISARSLGYTRRMLANAVSATRLPFTENGVMEDLQAKGVFQGLSPFAAMKVDEGAASLRSRAGQAVDVAQDAAFKATLLPTIYDGMAAGHYLTTQGDALNALTKFGREEITWKQVEKQTFLNRFDQPIIDRFKALAKDNAGDAAHYLGMQAVEDLVGTYGSGSHPYEWGTNVGRIAGQFGNFAMWIRSTTQRMATRGTPAERFGAIAKMTALSYGTVKAGDALGIDLTRMSPWHAMTWLLGPMIHMAIDASQAVHGSGYAQKSASRRLMKTLPVDGQGNFHPSIFVPGSFAVDGILQGSSDFGKHPMIGAAEMMGFKPTQRQAAPGL